MKRPARRPGPARRASIDELSEDETCDRSRPLGGRYDSWARRKTSASCKWLNARSLVLGTGASPRWPERADGQRIKRRLKNNGLPFETVATDRGAEFTATGGDIPWEQGTGLR